MLSPVRWGRVLAVLAILSVLAGLLVVVAPAALADDFLACDGPVTVKIYGPTPSGNTYKSKAKVCLVRQSSNHNNWGGVVRWTCFKNDVAYTGCRWDGTLQTRDANSHALYQSGFVCASCGGAYLQDSGQLFNFFASLCGKDLYETTATSRVRFLLGDGTSILLDSGEKISDSLLTTAYC